MPKRLGTTFADPWPSESEGRARCPRERSERHDKSIPTRRTSRVHAPIKDHSPHVAALTFKQFGPLFAALAVVGILHLDPSALFSVPFWCRFIDGVFEFG